MSKLNRREVYQLYTAGMTMQAIALRSQVSHQSVQALLARLRKRHHQHVITNRFNPDCEICTYEPAKTLGLPQ